MRTALNLTNEFNPIDRQFDSLSTVSAVQSLEMTQHTRHS